MTPELIAIVIFLAVLVGMDIYSGYRSEKREDQRRIDRLEGQVEKMYNRMYYGKK